VATFLEHSVCDNNARLCTYVYGVLNFVSNGLQDSINIRWNSQD